jgi:hypothetical protein
MDFSKVEKEPLKITLLKIVSSAIIIGLIIVIVTQ